MTDDIEAIQASLKRLMTSKGADQEASAKALMVAMHGIQAALAELIEAGDRDDTAAKQCADDAEKHRETVDAASNRIVQAIRSVKVEVPSMPAPTVNVAAPSVTVEAPNVTLEMPAQPAAVNEIIVMPDQRPRPIRYEIAQDVRTGKMIITPIYE